MAAVNRVQSKKQPLPGVMRISPEGTMGTWPGDNPNQCAQGYSCPYPTVTLDPYSPFGNLYIDVGAGGPAPFTWNVTSNATWAVASLTKGSISPSNTEERVFISVKDWDSLVVGANTAVFTFTAIASGQPPLAVPVTLVATKQAALPNGFKGFVEGSGAISMEAVHATRNTPVNGIAWTEIPGYGRTLSGVTTFPRDIAHDVNFTAGTGPSLAYDFYNFDTVEDSGNITVTVYVSPSWNMGEADRPLAFAVQLDSTAPQTQDFFPIPSPGETPNGWDTPDGFVANSILGVIVPYTGVSPGKHTLTLWAIEPAVVIQKIVIDCGGVQPSYLGPPESVII
ncbi:hypothetical protein C0991_005863 [Blastosporella zonata]|nr:hypothetical protein C0991_005863 [Blastosporella zonata]